MATQKEVLPQFKNNAGVEVFIGKRELKNVDVKTGQATFGIRSASGTGPDGPDFSVPIASVLTGSQEDNSEFWKMLVDSLMNAFREQGIYPEFVKDYEVTIDEDSAGDPAIYITLLVSPQQNPLPATTAEWSRFSRLVESALQNVQNQRWPYVRIGELRRKNR